ncbi:hypothetical protein GNY06_00800 [Elizabethkingia argentiflava]|uniref:Transposase n=1 Tax=Elizabethkingia argenteiflava TaxID=2681556 RepID=A0A845PSH6_9FLAO|nr:hypothetical protein [Elizabethkingia argenteiflava]
MNWIRSFGQEIQSLQCESKEITVVELDEMHSYIGNKKNCWIWIAVDRFGIRFINFVIGDRSHQTVEEFWETINNNKMEKNPVKQ